MKKTFKTTIVRDGSMCFIPLPFDPRPVFGKLRAPVKVTLNGYTYASTIASMGDGPCIPLRKSNREAAGLAGGETLGVTLELDASVREVKPAPDFVKALKAAPPAWERFRELSYSHQREHAEAVESAKKAETRVRRIEAAVQKLAARAPKRQPTQAAKKVSALPRMNAAWHERHPMPKKPTVAQRLAWHQLHQKNCGCRPMPAKLRAMLADAPQG